MPFYVSRHRTKGLSLFACFTQNHYFGCESDILLLFNKFLFFWLFNLSTVQISKHISFDVPTIVENNMSKMAPTLKSFLLI